MQMPELITSITSVAPSEIIIGSRLRPVKPNGVASIRASFEQTGVLKDAIGLRKKKDGKLHLIYGLHRLTFALEESWPAIDVKVWTCTDDWARLMEIDDNLAGADLDALDNAIFLAERKRVYEKVHPETARGVAGAKARWDATDMTSVASFSTTTAEKFGLSERQIFRMVAAGSALDAEDIALLRRADRPVTLSDLQEISKVDPDQRRHIVELLWEGKATSAVDALRQITAKPGDAVKPASDAKYRALTDAYARADTKTKRQFVADHFDELQDLMFPQNKASGDVVPFAPGRGSE